MCSNRVSLPSFAASQSCFPPWTLRASQDKRGSSFLSQQNFTRCSQNWLHRRLVPHRSQFYFSHSLVFLCVCVWVEETVWSGTRLHFLCYDRSWPNCRCSVLQDALMFTVSVSFKSSFDPSHSVPALFLLWFVYPEFSLFKWCTHFPSQPSRNGILNVNFTWVLIYWAIEEHCCCWTMMFFLRWLNIQYTVSANLFHLRASPLPLKENNEF